MLGLALGVAGIAATGVIKMKMMNKINETVSGMMQKEIDKRTHGTKVIYVDFEEVEEH